jgi:hypothetical protein
MTARTIRRLIGALVMVVAVAAILDTVHLLPPGPSRIVRTIEREIFGTSHRQTERRRRPAPEIARPVPDSSIDYAAVDRELATIRVGPERRQGYRREDWPHWIEQRGCINTREAVLVRDAEQSPQLSPDGCRILSGRWHDPYTDEEIAEPGGLDIDHVVPLEEAYGSGGYDWDREKRTAFANDVSDSRTLRAVSREANRAKGAKGPEEWLPPNPRFRCRYVADWVAIKARWLTMNESQRVAVGNILSDCRQHAG